MLGIKLLSITAGKLEEEHIRWCASCSMEPGMEPVVLARSLFLRFAGQTVTPWSV